MVSTVFLEKIIKKLNLLEHFFPKILYTNKLSYKKEILIYSSHDNIWELNIRFRRMSTMIMVSNKICLIYFIAIKKIKIIHKCQGSQMLPLIEVLKVTND